MTEREQQLLSASRWACRYMKAMRLDGIVGLDTTIRELEDALAAYDPPPPNPVFSQDVPFDSRAEFSLGHREKFGALEND